MATVLSKRSSNENPHKTGYNPTTFLPTPTEKQMQEKPAGPDYDTLILDEAKRAAYAAVAGTWSDDKGADVRGGRPFFEMLAVEFPNVAAKTGGTISSITQRQLNICAVMFANKGKLDELKWCVELGAELDYVLVKRAGENQIRSSALEAACYEGRDSLVTYLINNIGLNPNKRGGRLPIISASIGGHESTIKNLIQLGAWVTGVTAVGDNVISELIHCEHFELAQKMMKFLKDGNAQQHATYNFLSLCNGNQTLLSKAFTILCYIHTKFYEDRENKSEPLTSQERENLNTLLKPAIDNVKFVKTFLPQLSYGLPFTDDNGRKSKVPVYGYATVKDFSKRCRYVEDLEKADHAFFAHLIAEVGSNTTNYDSDHFYQAYVAMQHQRSLVF